MAAAAAMTLGEGKLKPGQLRKIRQLYIIFVVVKQPACYLTLQIE